MREILFRGKTYSDKWVYGYLLKGSIDNDFYILQNVGATPFWINPETIGQFTGLTDKNGKKIFERDIVKCEAVHQEYEDEYLSNYNYEDEYLSNYNIEVKYSKGYFYPFYLNGCWRNGIENVEVIGNIYDNPELLGE